MLLSPVATDIRFCNLTLYNGQVGLGLNKILQHKEMMFRASRGLGSSQRFCPLQRWSFFFKLLEWGTSFLRLQELRFASYTSKTSQRFWPLSRRAFFTTF